MGKLIYLFNVSIDGFIATTDRSLEWTQVDDELHAWFNEHARSVEASLYGRRLWEVMSAYWPTGESDPEATEVMREFARIWNRTPKIVFSRTLKTVAHGARLVGGDVATFLADVRREFFRPPYPTATGVIVADLLREGTVIEIKAIAVLR